MIETKFKIGDRVRYIGTHPNEKFYFVAKGRVCFVSPMKDVQIDCIFIRDRYPGLIFNGVRIENDYACTCYIKNKPYQTYTTLISEKDLEFTINDSKEWEE